LRQSGVSGELARALPNYKDKNDEQLTFLHTSFTKSLRHLFGEIITAGNFYSVRERTDGARARP
jgi:hypothetical protein